MVEKGREFVCNITTRPKKKMKQMKRNACAMFVLTMGRVSPRAEKAAGAGVLLLSAGLWAKRASSKPDSQLWQLDCCCLQTYLRCLIPRRATNCQARNNVKLWEIRKARRQTSKSHRCKRNSILICQEQNKNPFLRRPRHGGTQLYSCCFLVSLG